MDTDRICIILFVSFFIFNRSKALFVKVHFLQFLTTCHCFSATRLSQKLTIWVILPINFPFHRPFPEPALSNTAFWAAPASSFIVFGSCILSDSRLAAIFRGCSARGGGCFLKLIIWVILSSFSLLLLGSLLLLLA